MSGRPPWTPRGTKKASTTMATNTITIGDSISRGLAKAYPSHITAAEGLSVVGWRSQDLIGALKTSPVYGDTLNCVLSMGSNDGWRSSAETKNELIRLIRRVFPKANLYILNGNWGWGGISSDSQCDDKCWQGKVDGYILYFTTAKFNAIGRPTKVDVHPAPGDRLFATFDEDLKRYGLLGQPAAGTPGGTTASTPAATPAVTPPTGQQVSRGEYVSGTEPAAPSQVNRITSPGVVNLFQASVLPTTISIPTPSDDEQKRETLRGLGYSPIIFYNGYQIDFQYIETMSIYFEGMLPHLKVMFTDGFGLIKEKAAPVDNTKITVFIASRNDYLRPIHVDFKVERYVNEGGFMSIDASLDVDGLYYPTYKSYPNFTSNMLLQQICKDVGLGFNTNIVETNDSMTWLTTGERVYEFMQEVLDHAYVSDESFVSGNIDLYYNFNFVDVQKELARDLSAELGVSDESLTKVLDQGDTGKRSSLFLTNDEGLRNSANYFSGFRITNRSTEISLAQGYGDNITYYDTTGKSPANFSVDSLNLDADKSLVLKSPGDDAFFAANKNFVYAGKITRDNSHVNYNYVRTHNERNIFEADKLLMEVEIPIPNFNLYRFQKVRVVFSHQSTTPAAQMVNARYSGDWMITDVRFMVADGQVTQFVSMVRRELGLTEDEIKAGPPAGVRPSGRGTGDYRGSFANPAVPTGGGGRRPGGVPPSPVPGLTTDVDLTNPRFVGGQWKAYSIDALVSGVNATAFRPAAKFAESLRKILFFIKNDPTITNVRQAAYLLGTAFAESGYSLQRWEADYACGSQGVPYGESGPCQAAISYYRSASGSKVDYFTLGRDPKGLPYFGRGLIQLTGKQNYAEYGKNVGIDLVNNPDLALKEDISYKIAVAYMSRRTFKHVLAGNLTSARRSVNGGVNGLAEVNGAYASWLSLFNKLV